MVFNFEDVTGQPPRVTSAEPGQSGSLPEYVVGILRDEKANIERVVAGLQLLPNDMSLVEALDMAARVAEVKTSLKLINLIEGTADMQESLGELPDIKKLLGLAE